MKTAKQNRKKSNKVTHKEIKKALHDQYKNIVEAIDESVSNGGTVIEIDTIPYEIQKKLLKHGYEIEYRIATGGVSIYW